MLTDLAKIVIDYRKNKNADKGGFVIAHKAKNEVTRPTNNMQTNLKLESTKIELRRQPADIIINSLPKEEHPYGLFQATQPFSGKTVAAPKQDLTYNQVIQNSFMLRRKQQQMSNNYNVTS